MRIDPQVNNVESRNGFSLDYVASEVDTTSRKLFELFREHREQQFIFVEFLGNFGDYLIRLGVRKLANLAGIRFRSVSHEEFMSSDYASDEVIYIHGGGGFVPWWSGEPIDELRKAVSNHRGVTILGPQTFSTDQAFLKDRIVSAFQNIVSKEVFVYTRDPVSYTALKQCMPGHVELALEHDTALNLCSDDLVDGRFSGQYIFCVIRDDRESSNIQDRDLLAIWLDPVRYSINFENWMLLHVRARKIISNRLHSAITGAILGIPTILLPNSYHKNRSVWEYSLYQRGVQWQEDVPIRKISHTINRVYPLRKLLSSSEFQSALRAFYGVRRYNYRIRHRGSYRIRCRDQELERYCS